MPRVPRPVQQIVFNGNVSIEGSIGINEKTRRGAGINEETHRGTGNNEECVYGTDSDEETLRGTDINESDEATFRGTGINRYDEETLRGTDINQSEGARRRTNLNEETSKTLQRVPGIGPKIAALLSAELPVDSWDVVSEIYLIGPERIKLLQKWFFINGSQIVM